MYTEQLNNLFNIETSVKSTGTSGEQGSGLGLAICKEFITLNKGELTATSKKDQGSVFTFKLPQKN